MLRRLGLVRLRPEGNTHWYALDADALTRLARSVLSRELVGYRMMAREAGLYRRLPEAEWLDG